MRWSVDDPSIHDEYKEASDELGRLVTSNDRGGYNVIVTFRQRDLTYATMITRDIALLIAIS